MFRSLIALFWVSLSIIWIFFDKGIRDGDEEGHVGAAENSFLEPLHQDQVGTAIVDAWIGETGEYPPLGYAVMGWWWFSTETDPGLPHQPGDPQVRGILLGSLLVGAWATASLLRRRGEEDQTRPAELLTFITVLCLPLANGLVRHFMLEGMLMGCVALAILAAVRAAEHPSLWRTLALGLVLGGGMLIKQTFILYVALPLAWTLGPLALRRPWHLLMTLGTTALIGLPWYGQSWEKQLAYGQASAQTASESGALDQALFYPGVLWWQGLGPVLCIGMGLALLSWIRERNHGERLEPFQRRRMVLALVWLLGGLIVLTLIPKKYPRLVAPLTPAAALLIGGWVLHRARARWLVTIGAIALMSWTILSSVRLFPAPDIVERVDPGCIQHWIRPPAQSDLGLHAASVALRARPSGPIWVEEAPDIPCAVQTTHPWGNHLGPYLKREGMYNRSDQEASGHPDGSDEPETQVFVIIKDSPFPEAPPSARLVWGLEPPDVEVPELGGGFQVLGSAGRIEP